MEENNGINTNGTPEGGEAMQKKVGIVTMIWNGTKWVCKKTWKFVAGIGVGVALDRLLGSILGGGDDETTEGESTEETTEE